MKTSHSILFVLFSLARAVVAQQPDVIAPAPAPLDAAVADGVFPSLDAASPCVPVPDGLVSWWRAEGNTLDSWGANHGTAAAKFEAGEVGLGFTAASTMIVTNSASLRLTNGLTIEAWVNPQPPSPGVLYRSIVSKFDFAQFSQSGAGGYFLGLGYGNYPNGPVFMLTPSGFETNAVRLAPFTNLPSGQWSHLAATYDATSVRLYLNGALLAQSNYTKGIWPGTNNLGVGCTAVPGTTRTIYPFNGKIDEASIYRRALSDSEIAAIYAAGSAGKCLPSCVEIPTGAISWWPADGNGVDVLGTNRMLEGNSYSTGRVGLAFTFPRAGSVANDSPTLNFGANSNLSIEMWIQAAVTNSSRTNVPLLEKRTVSNAFSNNLTGVGYSLSLNSGRLAFWFSPNIAISNAAPFISPGPNLADGLFHHVGVTLNRTVTNGGKLFVDGQSVFTFDPTLRSGSLSNNSRLYFGTPTSTTLNTAFTGLMDETALYRRALTDAEMLAIYQAGPAGKCKSPPFVVTQPVNAHAARGSNVTLSVVAAGGLPLSYQWLRGDLVGLASATNASYTFAVFSSNSYSCRVFNAFGAVTSSVAIVTLNAKPQALNPHITVTEDVPQTFILAALDGDHDPLNYSIIAKPLHGTLGPVTNFPAPGTVTYFPFTNFNGDDSFTFKVNDGYEDSLPGTVTLTVLPVNDPPVADSQSVSLDEDTAASLTLVATDVDNDALTFAVGSPSHGTLSGAAPNLVYLPFTNYNGPDQFTFTVNDGTTDSAPATVSLTVLPVNDPPVPRVQVFTRFLLSGDDAALRVIAGRGDLAHVVFDASLTTDVDNDPLSFLWQEHGATNVIGAKVVVTNTLPPGDHSIELLVSDGTVTVTNAFQLQVITGVEAVDLFSNLVEASGLKHGIRQPLLALLHGAAHGFDEGHDWGGVHHLEIFQDRIRDWVAPEDAALADEWLWVAQEIIDAFGAVKPGMGATARLEQDVHGKRTLHFSGGQNRPYLVEASADLQNWEVIGAAVERSPGGYQFTDPDKGTALRRFYRIRTP